MKELTREQEVEVIHILKKRYHGWRPKSVNNVIKVINGLRTGKLKGEDYWIPGLVTNIDMVYDLFLNSFIEIS